MMQKISIMGLVRTLSPKLGAPVISARLSTLLSSSIILAPTSPIPVPAPVSPAENIPCSETDSEYSRTGTALNRLTAIKPLIALTVVCWRFPLPVEYSMPNSNPETTRLTPNSAQPSWEKNSTMACTQSRSNSSTPMLPMAAKKLPRKPTT